jgi:hypothetical protein
VYRRADLSRTFVLVVALLLAAVSTGAFARALRIPDPQGERHLIDPFFHSRHFGAEKEPHQHIRIGVADRNRTIVALIGTMTPVLIVRLHRVERI